ncbi:MAG TPA: hypothetical protein P5136_02330 [Methanofastidiosum sp.]|nr:hypothetical protein [Methanofastidiosum sp.]
MASLGYRLPGTRLEDVTQPKSVNISSTQRTPCFIGIASNYIKVTYEQVTRGTGDFDELAYSSAGIYQVTQTGKQRGLKDIIAGTHYTLVNTGTSSGLLWTTAGKAYVPSGSTYFVNYSYNRPYDPVYLTNPELNDYRYKEFTAFEDVVADLGDDIPTNPLVMICKIALKYFNVPKVATVQVRTTSSSDYADALSLILYRDVQTVCCLTTSAAVRTLLNNHVTERCLPDNMRFRMGWTGAATGTAIGDESDPNSIRGIAAGLKNELMVMVNATRAKYYYNDPTTREQLYTVVDGAFIAAVIAAYRDSFSYPCTNLLNKTISGLELYEEDYEDYYSEYMLEQAGSSSVFLVQNGTGGAIKVMDDLTTDNSTVERNNINIITAKHFIAKDVAIQMDRTFKGRLILDRGVYQNTVAGYLAIMFSIYKQAGIIEDVGTIKVTLPSTRRDTVEIFYSYYAVYTHKYTDGTYALEV